MKLPHEWFSTKPDIDDDTERPRRWWNWRYETYDKPGYGPDCRWRLIVGDLMIDMENDSGEPAPLRFDVELALFEDTGQFSESGYTDRHWHDHSVGFCVWRWGVYFAWRAGLR